MLTDVNFFNLRKSFKRQNHQHQLKRTIIIIIIIIANIHKRSQNTVVTFRTNILLCKFINSIISKRSLTFLGVHTF